MRFGILLFALAFASVDSFLKWNAFRFLHDSEMRFMENHIEWTYNMKVTVMFFEKHPHVHHKIVGENIRQVMQRRQGFNFTIEGRPIYVCPKIVNVIRSENIQFVDAEEHKKDFKLGYVFDLKTPQQFVGMKCSNDESHFHVEQDNIEFIVSDKIVASEPNFPGTFSLDKKNGFFVATFKRTVMNEYLVARDFGDALKSLGVRAFSTGSLVQIPVQGGVTYKYDTQTKDGTVFLQWQFEYVTFQHAFNSEKEYGRSENTKTLRFENPNFEVRIEEKKNTNYHIQYTIIKDAERKELRFSNFHFVQQKDKFTIIFKNHLEFHLSHKGSEVCFKAIFK